jgi:putative component of membrane protein insertase Oxa1/YidC/SpoIIIJ protein YidD
MMRWPLLLMIKLYWAIVPDKLRRSCLFSESCSRFVYRKSLEKGFFSGISALRYRWRNCRDGYHICEHPISGSKSLFLAGGDLVGEQEIAGRLLET